MVTLWNTKSPGLNQHAWRYLLELVVEDRTTKKKGKQQTAFYVQ